MSDATLRMLGRMNRVPPMVGRSAERVLLTEQLAAVKSGHGEVVIIGGEAGIGKSTIARNLIAQAESDGFLAIVGQNYDLMAAPPYGVWLDLAESYRHAATSVDMPPLPDGLASHNLDSITSQSAFFADVTAFVQALAAITPVIVLLEDVHWADPASLELLRHISTRLARVPLLLVVTYRVDEITRQNPFHHQLPLLVHDSGGLRLDLKRLDATDLDALVALMYGVPENDRSRLIGYLLDHAEGNPFSSLNCCGHWKNSLMGDSSGAAAPGHSAALTALWFLRSCGRSSICASRGWEMRPGGHCRSQQLSATRCPLNCSHP